MKISNLTLNNFRKYEQARFSFHPQFTIIIGENGAGKTTVLDATSIMLATYFQGSKIRVGSRTVSQEDRRLLLIEKGEQIFLEPQEEVFLLAQGTLNGNELNWQRDVGDRGGKAKELVKLGSDHRKEISRGENPNLPVLLYYGAGRLWDKHRHIVTEKPKSQLDAYRFCLDPKSDQKAFEKWFKKLSQSEFQKGQKSAALNTIKKAVIHCIPDAKDFFHDILNDTAMIRFQDESLMLFNNLSDGYRNMTAMVADIAHRSSRLNPHLGENAAEESTGVVLIDEIDLHLHPKWQRHVVTDLQKAFPKMQFIATTHSPFIIQSLDPGGVIDLNKVVNVPPGMLLLEGEREEQLVDIPTHSVLPALKPEAEPAPEKEYSSRSIEDIVEDIMGVELPQRSYRHQQMYDVAKKYYTVLQQAGEAGSSQKEELKEQLDELSAPFSDNVAYHAFLEMERLAAGLGKPKKSGQ